MRLHEITNKKERLDEIAPALVALAPWLANAARVIGPQIYKWIAKHGTKKVASHLMNKIHLGHKLHAVSDIGKKAIKKTPPDSSTPDALAKADVGYGTGQVDPPLAQAAKATSSKQVAPPKQVARPALPQGKMSPEAGAAIAQAQQAQRKRQRP